MLKPVASILTVSLILSVAACGSSPFDVDKSKRDVVSDTAELSELDPGSTPGAEKIMRTAALLKCPHYKVFYIDPETQFFTPPVPLEAHAEFVFCADHANLDEIRVRIKKMKPIGSTADVGSQRIKVIPRGRADETIVFCSTGEITYKGKQYRLDRRVYEPSILSLREEGDRQRALANEAEADAESDFRSGNDAAIRKAGPRRPASSRPQQP